MRVKTLSQRTFRDQTAGIQFGAPRGLQNVSNVLKVFQSHCNDFLHEFLTLFLLKLMRKVLAMRLDHF